MKRLKVNKKSLKQKGGNVPPKMSMDTQTIVDDIREKLDGGIAEEEVLKNLMDQYIPLDEIQTAFMSLGYDESRLSSIMDRIQESADKTNQSDELPQARVGMGNMFFPQNLSQAHRSADGFRPAEGFYLPQALANEGNVIGAVANAAEAFGDLFSSKEVMGPDGKTPVKKGAFRDLRSKMAQHKDRKGEYYSYNVTVDPNDPNEYANDITDLYNASKKGTPLRTADQFNQDVADNTKLNYNVNTGQYDTILSSRPINEKIYKQGLGDKIGQKLFNKEGIRSNELNVIQDGVTLQNFADILSQNRGNAELIAQNRGLIENNKLPFHTSYGVSDSGSAGAYTGANPYLYNTMMLQNIYTGAPTSEYTPSKGGGLLQKQMAGETKKEMKNRIKNYDHPYLAEYIEQFQRNNKSNETAIKDIMSQMGITGQDTLFMGNSPSISGMKMRPEFDLDLFLASQKDPDAFNAGQPVTVTYKDREKYDIDDKTYMNDVGNYLHLIKTSLNQKQDGGTSTIGGIAFSPNNNDELMQLLQREMLSGSGAAQMDSDISFGQGKVSGDYPIEPPVIDPDSDSNISESSSGSNLIGPDTGTYRPINQRNKHTWFSKNIGQHFKDQTQKQRVKPPGIFSGRKRRYLQGGGDVNTLYEYYTGMDQNLPSISDRRTMFQDAGLGQQYSGTAAQNNQLLSYLQDPANMQSPDDEIAQNIELDEVTVTAPRGERIEPIGIQPLTVDPPDMQLRGVLADGTIANQDPNDPDPNNPDPSFADPQVKRGNKFFGTAQRILDNPLTRAYGKLSTAVVAGAGVVNAMADRRAKNKAERDLRFSTMADNMYGLYDEQDGDRGLFDVNTGLYQPDNLRGYAMMGQEVGMESKPQSDIVDLDYETITKLISAGADIEIL